LPSAVNGTVNEIVLSARLHAKSPAGALLKVALVDVDGVTFVPSHPTSVAYALPPIT